MFALSSVIYFSTVGRYTYIGMYSVRAAGILAGSEIWVELRCEQSSHQESVLVHLSIF